VVVVELVALQDSMQLVEVELVVIENLQEQLLVVIQFLL
jgi:hypothetical protein